ncbi:penicillin-binding transpeptidase domain-containing protein [Speluncibacter jeojiensis]|uniref:Penicillin-binding transpeptidase domain-containing protein n=1 Tax=Speluncibacter jeojiensis TaxID=2710754 RepID=A0A9X4RJC3_9ACTN|nr:penicillin-binding transpeptidase domain-containing protein [Corynebacteriales bacterium D3-21]
MIRSHTHGRRVVPLAVLTALVAASAACGDGTSPDQRALDSFVAAVHSRDSGAAAAQTGDPRAATAGLRASLDGMGDAVPTMTVGDADSAGTRPTTTVWRIRDGVDATTTGTVTVTGGHVQWSPQVLDTRLQPGGRLLYSDDLDYTAPVVDRGGRPVMSWQTVTLVNLAPTAPASSADAVADAVHAAAPSITAADIRQAMAAAPGHDYTVVTLRADDVDPIRSRLAAIPGVTLPEQGRLLTASRQLRSPAFGALPDIWQNMLRANAGWSVSVDNPQGAAAVASGPGKLVDPLHTTLDGALQQAAQRAVDTQTRPAVVVALSPSTGGVLAVAQNRPADEQGPVALTGLYPPGSTFKTVTTSAALDAGVATADDRLPCPGVATVEGRTIPNEDEFDLGTVPLHTAFAQSCNTTQAMLAVKLAPRALTDTAAALGLGVDFVTPGLTTVTGKVPVTSGGAERVEAAIGQGAVLASPFGMAVAEASLANGGTMIRPSLLAGQAAKADRNPEPLPQSTVSALRAMMRETVASGTARSLRDIDGLGGKTGTAEVSGKPAHGWFVGIDGDVAFAAFIDGADSSGPAVQMAGTFLRGADETA